jgi:hypothetical protein
VGRFRRGIALFGLKLHVAASAGFCLPTSAVSCRARADRVSHEAAFVCVEIEAVGGKHMATSGGSDPAKAGSCSSTPPDGTSCREALRRTAPANI